MAEEHGLDIREIAARYPGEKIGKREILRFLEERKRKEVQKEAEAPGGGQEEDVRPLSGALRAMAEHMALSTRTAARVTTMAEVDMTELVKLREALKEKFKQDYGVSLTYVPFVIRAICQGVKEFPILNAFLRGEEVIFHRSVNLGIAVDTGESLLVPVIQDAADKGIVRLSREAMQLSEKARGGRLALRDIQGGTISLTNAGIYGALLATPIIHQPQSAILWMGKVMETPVVREGQIVIRSMMYLCLSYDHRIIMGAQAVRFLQVVKKSLETPHSLLLD
jgi:pyruvate/2-oxoglutarate dehydrogenase complex dihydrolipoamide acyltransferase (E2) component